MSWLFVIVATFAVMSCYPCLIHSCLDHNLLSPTPLPYQWYPLPTLKELSTLSTPMYIPILTGRSDWSEALIGLVRVGHLRAIWAFIWVLLSCWFGCGWVLWQCKIEQSLKDKIQLWLCVYLVHLPVRKSLNLKVQQKICHTVQQPVWQEFPASCHRTHWHTLSAAGHSHHGPNSMHTNRISRSYPALLTLRIHDWFHPKFEVLLLLLHSCFNPMWLTPSGLPYHQSLPPHENLL